MKIQSALAALLLGAVLASPAFAQNSQQSKMTACNQQAGDKKGDDRKAFMKTCLSSAPANETRGNRRGPRAARCAAFCSNSAAPVSGAAATFLLVRLPRLFPRLLPVSPAVHLPGNRPPATHPCAVHPGERVVFLL